MPRVLIYCGTAFVKLSLTLLVSEVVADDHDNALATDDFALIANLLDAWLYLHL